MNCPNCKSEMEVQHVCEQCGEKRPVMDLAPLDDQAFRDRTLRTIVEPFIASGDTSTLNPLFDAYEPLITAEKDSGLRLGEWNKLKADVRGLAIAIMRAARGESI